MTTRWGILDSKICVNVVREISALDKHLNNLKSLRCFRNSFENRLISLFLKVMCEHFNNNNLFSCSVGDNVLVYGLRKFASDAKIQKRVRFSDQFSSILKPRYQDNIKTVLLMLLMYTNTSNSEVLKLHRDCVLTLQTDLNIYEYHQQKTGSANVTDLTTMRQRFFSLDEPTRGKLTSRMTDSVFEIAKIYLTPTFEVFRNTFSCTVLRKINSYLYGSKRSRFYQEDLDKPDAQIGAAAINIDSVVHGMYVFPTDVSSGIEKITSQSEITEPAVKKVKRMHPQPENQAETNMRPVVSTPSVGQHSESEPSFLDINDDEFEWLLNDRGNDAEFEIFDRLPEERDQSAIFYE